MTISVVTVCYNSADTIRDTLASVASQRDVRVEHIVVDGGSADGTVAALEERGKSGEATEVAPGVTLRWISEPDRGLYDAINKGIRMATGEVVGILNSDDVFEDDYTLYRVEEKFRSGDWDAIYGDVRFVRELGGATVRYCSARRFKPWMFTFGVMAPHPSFYCRRECFEKYGHYSLDYRICADFELMLRFMRKHGIRSGYLDACMVTMRTGGVSTAGIGSNIRINREDLRALRSNGYWGWLPLMYLKYAFKIWGFVFRRSGK